MKLAGVAGDESGVGLSVLSIESLKVKLGGARGQTVIEAFFQYSPSSRLR